MTKEDAKEMIKLVATDEGLVDVESVMKILDRIDVNNSNLSYAPGVRDTYIDKCMSDKDMFRIHPEDGPFYDNRPRDCFGNPLPYCCTEVHSGDALPNKGVTLS